jgi:hypothetical protein
MPLYIQYQRMPLMIVVTHSTSHFLSVVIHVGPESFADRALHFAIFTPSAQLGYIDQLIINE